jgi:NADH:ubiquinone oxidoreductase subunit 6 (subunit J)
MEVFAVSPTQLAGGEISLAAVLALAGFYLLLPRPRGRYLAGGIAALIAAAGVFTAWLQTSYGNPMPDLVGTILFWFFSAGALGFGCVLVVQRNPARGAIAFAFVIISTCGLFLLLAAPFLMAATIIIYAGAIIVTFLFVLMLSQAKGESNENDRSREPLFGALAGFAFVGLVLFTVYLNYLGKAESPEEASSSSFRRNGMLPLVVLTNWERERLADVLTKLDGGKEKLDEDLSKGTDDRARYFEEIKNALTEVVGSSQAMTTGDLEEGSIRKRLEQVPGKAGAGQVLYREDEQARAVLRQAAEVRKLNWEVWQDTERLLLDRKHDPARVDKVKERVKHLRNEVALLSGSGLLPARNVGNLGFLLYSEHLLTIELAGTLLLVATLGAVAIAQRKGVPE